MKLTFIDKGKLRGMGLRLPLDVEREYYSGARATVDASTRQRITATRVALLGPVALLAKKNGSQAYVTVQFADGTECVSQPVKDEHKARKWAADFNTWAAKVGG